MNTATIVEECFAGEPAAVGVDFRDKNKRPVVPSAVSFTVTDYLSGTVLYTETSVSPLSTAATIDVPAAATAVVNASLGTELRIIDVTYIYSGEDAPGRYRAFLRVVHV